jgi:hypothetical protein
MKSREVEVMVTVPHKALILDFVQLSTQRSIAIVSVWPRTLPF